MNLKTLARSRSFQGVLIGILITVLALVIFQAGVAVGQHRAGFAGHLGDSYERNLVAPRVGGDLPFDRLKQPPLGGHGAAGEVVSVSLPTFVVAGPDKVEKTVVVSDDTLYREYRDESRVDDLAVGSFVVVLGDPNDSGEIEAKLIRFLPPPESITREASAQ